MTCTKTCYLFYSLIRVKFFYDNPCVSHYVLYYLLPHLMFLCYSSYYVTRTSQTHIDNNLEVYFSCTHMQILPKAPFTVS